MLVPFWKMHGAGNDFILFDYRSEALVLPSRSAMKLLCARRTGIGADGLIFIRASTFADVAVSFFNADGSQADMCGNGARCAARLARELQAVGNRMRIETRAGCIVAEVQRKHVRVQMNSPKAWRSGLNLNVGRKLFLCDFLNTGVPHAVIETSQLDAIDLPRLGQLIRRHEVFGQEGANVNFVSLSAPNALAIRTYERGVEAETLACGTGAVASALAAGRAGKAKPPVQVKTRGGYILEVDYKLTDDGAEDVTLAGPACLVFQGSIDLEELENRPEPINEAEA